jgi:transposase
MEHIAIDLGGSQSQVCVRGSDGQVLEERRHKTIDLARYLAKRPLFGTELPSYVEQQLQVIELLTEQIRQANRELSAIAKADPVCRRLMTVPGVGWLTALRFVTTLDEQSRFADGHRVASYLGLVPGEYSSSDYQRRTGITKAGSPSMRWMLVQAAWSARRSRRRGALQQWVDQVEQRRGKRVAVVALARKLAGIMFAIWRDGTTYQPERAANS